MKNHKVLRLKIWIWKKKVAFQVEDVKVQKLILENWYNRLKELEQELIDKVSGHV